MSFRKTRNFGRKTLRELWVLLEKLAEHGADAIRYGNSGAPPPSIDEFVTRVLQSLSEKDERMLRRHYLDGATMRKIGLEEGVSGHAIGLRINRILLPIRARLSATARELMVPLISAMEDSGGLVHRDFAQKLTSTDDLRRICLAALIAGFFNVRIWRGEFLITMTSKRKSKFD
ncbi:MAG: hypothetical protein J2P21_24070 [Chloracidobacterium sp.]|nr:hypothetical protein [Chloracidobacterium sp.]